MVGDHLEVSEAVSLMEVSLFKILVPESVHIDVGQICLVPDDVFMITSSPAGKGNVAIHIATLQECSS